MNIPSPKLNHVPVPVYKGGKCIGQAMVPVDASGDGGRTITFEIDGCTVEAEFEPDAGDVGEALAELLLGGLDLEVEGEE